MSVVVIVGTDKGGFVLRSDASRSSWQIDGPIHRGWKVTAAARAGDGTWLMATTSNIYGPAIQLSRDLKEWRQAAKPPAYAKGGERKLTQIWKLLAHENVCYAGVDEAGLFRSSDNGDSWQPVAGLNEHHTREAWYPGNGGLCAHSIMIDSTDANRIWCGVSAVGVFRSDDGGETWHLKNEGVPPLIEDKKYADIGRCVHALVQDPSDPRHIFRQEHSGVFHSHDLGENWTKFETGLVPGFGFPLVLDRRSRSRFAAPLESDEGRMPENGAFRIFRSRDGGASWQALTNGLPQEHAYFGVMRGAMDVDPLDPCGVYFGTTGGDVYVSADCGDRWTLLPYRLPRIHSIDAFIES